ncbi:MAG: hypothetical protein U1F56_03555 [Rubrivivax sp.]
MTLRNTFLGLLIASGTFAAFAQTPPAPGASTPGVDARQQRQEQRIEQGKASGELTKREAHRLERQQKRIDRAEAKAKADGTVTAGERAKLQGMQDNASRNIRHQKHDRQHRPAKAASAP